MNLCYRIPAAYCPYCGHKGGVSAEDIVDSKLKFVQADVNGILVNHTTHMQGAIQDCKCSNCDGQFMLLEGELE